MTEKAYNTEKLSLRSNFLWMLVGNIVYGLCQWGFLSAIAKLSSPEILGQYTLAIAICTPMILSTNLQLRSVQATDIRHEFSFGHYLGLRIVSSFVAVVGLTILAVVLDYSLPVKLIVVVVGIQKIAESLCDIVYGYFQNQERLDRIAISIMTRSILSITAFLIVLSWTRSLVLSLGASLLAAILVFALYDLRHAAQQKEVNESVESGNTKQPKPKSRKIKPVFDRHVLFQLAKMALPLGIGAVIVSFFDNIPRYIIEHSLGQYDLGIYGALSYPMLAGISVVHALAQSASPVLARYHSDSNRKEFSRLMGRLVIIGIFISCAGILVAAGAGKPLLTLLYGREYADYYRVFVLLMGVAGFSYVSMFLNYGLVAIRRFNTKLAIQMSALITCCVTSFLLTGKYGLMGAAFGIGAGYMVVTMGSAYVLASYGCRNKNRWHLGARVVPMNREIEIDVK